MRDARLRVILALASFCAVTVAGTIGYVVVEGASLLDALYQTVITVFAVGFAEVIELSSAGRVLTLVIIVTGVGSLTLATAAIIEFLVEGHLRDLLGRRRMTRQLTHLEHHTIVCGFGRVGRQTTDDLVAQHETVCVVDLDGDRVARARERGVPYIQGDASHESVLLEAGIGRARSLVAATNDDAENVLIALTANGVRPDIFTVVRVKDIANESKALRAGADRVIAPAAIGGHRIAALVMRPSVVDFLDVVTHHGGADLLLEELTLADGAPLCGRRLRETGLRERYGVNVVAMRERTQQRPHLRPDPEHVLEAGDLLVLLGAPEDLLRVLSEAGVERRPG